MIQFDPRKGCGVSFIWFLGIASTSHVAISSSERKATYWKSGYNVPFLKAEESNPHRNWYKSKFLSFLSLVWKRHISRGKEKLFRVLQPVKFGPDTVPEMTGKISSGYLRVPECSESNSVALENEYHRHWKKKNKNVYSWWLSESYLP